MLANFSCLSSTLLQQNNKDLIQYWLNFFFKQLRPFFLVIRLFSSINVLLLVENLAVDRNAGMTCSDETLFKNMNSLYFLNLCGPHHSKAHIENWWIKRINLYHHSSINGSWWLSPAVNGGEAGYTLDMSQSIIGIHSTFKTQK